jgi:hypothetical protein
VLSASLLATASAHLVGGTASGVATGAAATGGQNANPNTVFVDRLFRADMAAQSTPGGAGLTTPDTAGTPTSGTAGSGTSGASAPQNSNVARAEVGRLWTSSFTDGNGLQPADRAYVAHLIAQQIGISDADAQKTCR